MNLQNNPSNSNPSGSMQPIPQICSICHKQITGSFFEADGGSICFECRQKTEMGSGEPSPFRRWRGFIFGGGLLLLAVAGAVYFTKSWNQPQSAVPPDSSAPAPAVVSTAENSASPFGMDTPTPEDTPAATEATKPTDTTPTPSVTEETTPTDASPDQTVVSTPAEVPSPVPSSTPVSGPADSTPLSTSPASMPSPNPAPQLPTPLANSLATTPLPDSLGR